jgi:hypothetical protein
MGGDRSPSCSTTAASSSSTTSCSDRAGTRAARAAPSMDALDGVVVHLAHRDVAFVAASRAPLDELQRYRERMGWSLSGVVGRNDVQPTSMSRSPSRSSARAPPQLRPRRASRGRAAGHERSRGRRRRRLPQLRLARGLDPLNGATRCSTWCPRVATRTTCLDDGLAAPPRRYPDA